MLPATSCFHFHSTCASAATIDLAPYCQVQVITLQRQDLILITTVLYRDTLDDTIQDLRALVHHFKAQVLVKGDSEHAAMKAMERIIWLVASTQSTTDDRVP